MNTAKRLTELLGLRTPPIAVAFKEKPPDGMQRIEERAASGCTYWKLAGEGRAFYTEASDHFGCPVGSHTHGVDLPADEARELEGLIATMVQLEYLRPEEVAGIPRREEPFGVAIYSPLADSEFDPDVVLISGSARQMMLLNEAVHAAGLASDASMVGRPTCAAIPAVLRSGQAASNLGCIGNRVYTELPDDELYCVIPGSRLEAVVGKLSTIVKANEELEAFHRGRIS